MLRIVGLCKVRVYTGIKPLLWGGVTTICQGDTYVYCTTVHDILANILSLARKDMGRWLSALNMHGPGDLHKY